MDQRCRRIVRAPGLVLLEAGRPARGANGLAGRKPLHEGLESVGDDESAPRLCSVSGMELELSPRLAGNAETERELRDMFGVPLSVRSMPGSKKETYRELELDFEDE